MEKTLTIREKLSYGSAGFGDSATYAVISTFLLFFLTTVAGLQPAFAGTIIAIGSLWDVLMCPVIGYISDNCHSRLGRRRPFLLGCCVPLALFTVLLFTAIDASYAFKAVYYFVVMILLWTVFSGFYVPYIALGASMTDNYDERTLLRSYSSAFNTMGLVLGTVFPSIAVDFLCSRGLSLGLSWQLAVGVISLFSTVAILLCYKGAKAKDIPLPKPVSGQQKSRFSFKAMFLDFADVLKLKPIRWLVAADILSITGLTVFASDRLYYLTYNMNYGSDLISLVLLAGCLFGFLAPPVITIVSKWLDKRSSFIVIVGCSSLLLLSMKFLKGDSLPFVLLVFAIYAVGYMSFWQLITLLLYDVGEYDQYINGKNRVGSISSIHSISEAIADALSIQLLGVILQFAGFDGDSSVQTATCMTWIENCMFVIPVVFLLAACLCVKKYPITKRVFLDIQSKLDR